MRNLIPVICPYGGLQSGIYARLRIEGRIESHPGGWGILLTEKEYNERYGMNEGIKDLQEAIIEKQPFSSLIPTI